MIYSDYKDLKLNRVTDEGSKNVSIRWLIGKDIPDAPFYMRVLELEPGGNTPFHSHEWEHEIFVLEGEGVLKTDNDELSLEYGRFAFIKKGENHQFVNSSSHKIFRFICLIPK